MRIIKDIKYVNKEIRNRNKSISIDGTPRVKYTSYEYTPLTGKNVVHIGTRRNYTYVFGYSHDDIITTIQKLKASSLSDVSKEKLKKALSSIKEIDEKIEQIKIEKDELEKKAINSKDPKFKRKVFDEIREYNVTIGGLNDEKKKYNKERNKLLKALDKVIVGEMYLNSPRGHYVTAKGIVRDIEVPKHKIVYVREVFMAYKVKITNDDNEKVNNIISMMEQYDNGETFYHLHGKYASMVIDKLKDMNHKYKDRVLYIKSTKEYKHIVPALFGKIPIRLTKHQGNEYYKYIYDTNFFKVELPYLFRINFSHVVIKNDISLDKDGYYNIILLDYKEKDFEESNKEPSEVYGQEIVEEESKHYRRQYEFLGAYTEGMNMVKIGIKNPPNWLYRLLEAMSKYDGDEFLICRAEEFTDQWHLLLMEHIDQYDIDLVKEISPFVDHGGVYLPTGNVCFRQLKPRWLSFTLQRLIHAHDDTSIPRYDIDLRFIESKLGKHSSHVKQRTNKGHIDERKLVFPLSTPFGKILIKENINFPNVAIWKSIQSHLTAAYATVCKYPDEKFMYTSTTFKTKEYSIRWHSPYDSVVNCWSTLDNYNDYLSKEVTINAKTHKDPTSDKPMLFNMLPDLLFKGKDLRLDDYENITNTTYWESRPDVIDHNLVRLNLDTLEVGLKEDDINKSFDTTRAKDKVEFHNMTHVYKVGSEWTDEEKILINKRGVRTIDHHISTYDKNKVDIERIKNKSVSMVEVELEYSELDPRD